MLSIDETSLEIGPEYTEDLVHTRHMCSIDALAAAIAKKHGLPETQAKAKEAEKEAEKEKQAQGQSDPADKPAQSGAETTAESGARDVADEPVSERFEEQCFLLDAISPLSKGNLGQTYENLIVLNGDNQDAAKLISKINSRFGETGTGLRDFLDMTPSQTAMLVPKIRLFVQKFQSKDDPVGVFQEITFRDWTDKSSVESIMASAAGRGDDAGLVNLTYEYDGRDPASTTNMIKVGLKMLFTDFETIVKPIRTSLTDYEKNHFNPKTDEDHEYIRPRYLDLILRQPMRDTSTSKSLPYFIKVYAEIGWHEPENASEVADFPEELRKYIASGLLNEYFTLTMVEHDMDFKEDGRIELTIDFRAGVENVLFNNTDILALDPAEEKKFKDEIEEGQRALKKDRSIAEVLEKKRKAAEAAKAKDDGSPTLVEQIGNFLSPDKDAAVIKGRAATAETLSNEADNPEQYRNWLKFKEKQIEHRKEIAKAKRYRSLLTKLEESEKIKYFDLKTELVNKWLKELNSANLDPESTPNRLRSSQILFQAGVASTSMPGADFKQTTTIAAQTAGKDDLDRSSLAAAGKAVDAREARSRAVAAAAQSGESPEVEKPQGTLEFDRSAADKPLGPEVYRIHFMYLGDIMDIACRTLYNLDLHLGITRVVAGPVQYLNNAGEIQNINLADIPISLEVLSNWIFTNIIAKGSPSMSLGKFLTSLTTDLAFEALGERSCFGSIVGYPSMLMTPITLNLVGSEKQGPVVRNAAKKYPRITVDDFAKSAKVNLASKGLLTSQKRVNSATYIFITGVIREENNFNYGVGGFNPAAASDGIYTLGIGRDRGIVKNIKFNKSQAKYQAEMRVEQKETTKVSTLGELRQVYNASVTLVGNTLFKNGQYVRIDPSTMGMNPKTAVELGLGGYYVVTRVEGDLSREGYTTTLTCKYNSATGTVTRRLDAARKRSGTTTPGDTPDISSPPGKT